MLNFRTYVVATVILCAPIRHERFNNSSLADGNMNNINRRQQDNTKAYEITQRLRAGLNGDKLELRPRIKTQYEKANGGLDTSTVYHPSHGYKFADDGLPVARISSVIIKGDVKEVAAMWNDIKGRHQWDKTAAMSSVSISSEDGIEYNYFRGKAGWLIPARDFVFTSVTLPPAVVGLNSINSVVIFRKDARDKLPASGGWNIVRGEQNSLLVLEPLGLTRTKATLLVECDPKGWGWMLGPGIVDFCAGDSIVQSLWWLKRAIEADVEDDSLSVEEIAQRRFKRKQEREKELGATILDDMGATSKEDLLKTVSVLEASLARLAQDERESGLNLRELKERIQSDLAKAKSRL